jgi:hypothetical protein
LLLDELNTEVLSFLAERSVLLAGAVALDRFDVLVGRLRPELVGEVQVKIAILGLEFLLKKRSSYSLARKYIQPGSVTTRGGFVEHLSRT